MIAFRSPGAANSEERLYLTTGLHLLTPFTTLTIIMTLEGIRTPFLIAWRGISWFIGIFYDTQCSLEHLPPFPQEETNKSFGVDEGSIYSRPDGAAIGLC